MNVLHVALQAQKKKKKSKSCFWEKKYIFYQFCHFCLFSQMIGCRLFLCCANVSRLTFTLCNIMSWFISNFKFLYAGLTFSIPKMFSASCYLFFKPNSIKLKKKKRIKKKRKCLQVALGPKRLHALVCHLTLTLHFEVVWENIRTCKNFQCIPADRFDASKCDARASRDKALPNCTA